MRIEQKIYKQHAWVTIKEEANNFSPQLLFVFGAGSLLKNENLVKEIQTMYPTGKMIGCSTAGEIGSTCVNNESIIVTAVQFEKTTVSFCAEPILSMEDSYAVGQKVVFQLLKPQLKHIILFSDGLNINGTQLVKGCQSELLPGINITGGLAGDGARFTETFVLCQDGNVKANHVVAVGLYSDDLSIGCASYGGWDIFGIERLVTKSIDNKLFEIDNMPALALYKSFLGEKAKDLPASALLFPLSIRTQNDETPVVRTILSINEDEQSMTFAGDVPKGAYVRLMKADVNRLIDGAATASKHSLLNMGESKTELALLVSCVGRQLVLNQLVEEEIECVQEAVGNEAVLAGFYSYGEISPFKTNQKCELHNQTMTITTISETC